MATIDKLNYLNETKEQIKTSLNNLGAEITNDTTFRDYVDKINEIAAEYPTQEQITSFQNIQSLQQPLNLQPTIKPTEEIQPLEETIENDVQNLEEIESTDDVQNEEVE